MEISNEALQEFIRIYKKEFDVDLTLGQAQIVAAQLVTLYERLAQPLPGELRKDEHEPGDEGDIGDVVEGKEDTVTQPPDPQNPHASPSVS